MAEAAMSELKREKLEISVKKETVSTVQNDKGSTEIPSEVNLATGIEEAAVALNLFLNNKFSEAKERMQPWADRSIYHALGYCTIMYLQAAMTFERADIDLAIETIKKSIEVCNKFRKKTSVVSAIARGAKGQKINYDNYTTEEIHAELCYAECLIQRALMTFVQDENLISFVKGALKIRACYLSYKECSKMLQNRTWNGCKEKIHFESGVRMGIGAFNLLISLLPTRVLKLLEFVGFSGNKRFGLKELELGSSYRHSLRGPLCSIILIAYHTLVTYVLGTADGDIPLAETVLTPCLQSYPRGALFLFFAGRIEEIKANLDEAILRFEESVESQMEWKQFHHLCYWELMWCHSFKCDWLMAMKYAEKLCHESRWSKATYTYQKASFLMMCADKTEETMEHINYLYGEVPRLQQRIAGKSIPIEKFAVKKAKRFIEQKNRLTLPALELIYVWNGFSIIGKRTDLVEPIISVIEATINTILESKESFQYFTDDYCLALHLKGVCLKHLGRTFQAEICFKEVCDSEKKLKCDNYLVPWAHMELALLCMQQQRPDEAKKLLDKAKHFKGYSLESRLHFRIHAANIELRSSKEDGASGPEGSVASTPEDELSMGVDELRDALPADMDKESSIPIETTL
ncbi:tetratricopeptide repeat protein 39B isoform X1 [Lingula anatina]|uniref:Tetratricopeptide repeat protein 39B isoform X1 n=1 Tax=Lingula anatina TaxID=7574 RepID=A0A1S3JTR4_LINAN|nr:tetratricopeptide repeat protein 39B isoform X1 [Lingula anatina]|eukprot:XP_013413737.2 tetratricopeptide repeat protein 39B isoform X1 [Lingula anatina]